MGTSDSEGGFRSATKGLATIALLKVNFDAGKDHIGMFEPFVLDAVVHMNADAVTVDDVQRTIDRRHQLALPTNTLRTLLGRAVKKGFVRREGGRYFHTEKKADVADLRLERQRIEERQNELAEAFCSFATERGVAVATTEDALAMALDFLDRYHVSLALGEVGEIRSAGVSDPATETDTRTTITARFLRDTVSSGGHLADVVQEMLEGFVLQNALLLKDISTASRQFKNLHVLCDSGLLFGALGLCGEAAEVATRELFSLLKSTGAILDVFEPTIREMRQILAVYEDRIGTPDGRASLYPTDLTRYLLTNHFSPSDVRVQSGLIERNLRAFGLNIRDLPKRQALLTLDEADLGRRLADQTGENAPRVIHDIDCVAGVLTFRRGRTSNSLDEAGAVFVTKSGLTARNTTEWYESQGGRGVSPIVHYLVLSNLAWLKRPASASRLKLHELIALCTAALRPARKAWEAFLAHLKKLEASGELSSDEVTAIIATELTDNILVEEAVDEDSDAATLSEVVDRVKAAYREEAEAEIAKAHVVARDSESEALQLRMHIERRSRSVARSVSWALAALVAAGLFGGTAVTIAEAATGSSLSPIALGLAVVLGLAGLWSLLSGFHVNRWRRRFEERVADVVKRWMSGQDSHP